MGEYEVDLAKFVLIQCCYFVTYLPHNLLEFLQDQGKQKIKWKLFITVQPGEDLEAQHLPPTLVMLKRLDLLGAIFLILILLSFAR